jgi:hypothetical protein
MGAKNRVGKVFVDYLRNNRGATSACAFSARARPHLGVSVPVAWDELVELRGGDQWTIRTLPQRLDDLKGHDPWADYEKSRQTLTEAARLLAGDLPSVGDEDPDTELPEPASPTRKRDPSASARARSTRAAGAPAGRASASRPAAASKAEAKKTGPKAR